MSIWDIVGFLVLAYLIYEVYGLFFTVREILYKVDQILMKIDHINSGEL